MAHRVWPGRRSVRWYLGLVGYALASMSAIGVYAHVLFSARTLQVTTLMMIVPQLWAHGLPLTLARDSVTERTRRVLRGDLHARLTQLLTHPVVGVVVLIGLPIGLYGRRWYVAGLFSHPVGELTQLALQAGGFHYFWTRLQQDPVPKLYPQVVTVVLTLVDVAVDSIVPMALIFVPVVVGADYYTLIGRDWGPSLPNDQDIGAGVLWGLGDLAGIPFLLLAVAQWMRRERVETEKVDRYLDEREQARRHEQENNGQQAGSRTSLWWEDDPTLAEHFHWKRPCTATCLRVFRP